MKLMINRSEIFVKISWIKVSLFLSMAFLILLSLLKCYIGSPVINNQMLKIWFIKLLTNFIS